MKMRISCPYLFVVELPVYPVIIVVTPESHLLKPIRVVSGGNVGARDGAVEPTGTYSRRFPEEMTRIGRSITQRKLLSRCHSGYTPTSLITRRTTRSVVRQQRS